MSNPVISRPRPFTPDDYEGYVALGNRCYPDYPGSVTEKRHQDETWDHSTYFRQRLVIEEQGRLVASGELNHSRWTFKPEKYSISVQTDPDHRGRGLGSLIYDALVATALEREGRELVTGVKESMEDGLKFAVARGFTEVKRDWESRLDVSAFDFSRFASAPARVAEQGLRIVTLAEELARDPEVLRALYELEMECAADVPSTDPFTPRPYEVWHSEEIEAPAAAPEAYYIAVSPEGRYLGLSNLWRSLEDPSFIWQGLTAVRREARGKGIAMALKLKTVEYALAHGIGHIKTWNDQRNRPMLRINEAMGFAKQPAWIEMRRSLP